MANKLKMHLISIIARHNNTKIKLTKVNNAQIWHDYY